jgi:hypothetical protein
MYIEFAELQAMRRMPMTMNDWITKLDEFLKLSDRELLDHAGKVSTDAAKAKAEAEYAKYRSVQDAKPRAIDVEFEKVAKQLTKPNPKSRPVAGSKARGVSGKTKSRRT